MRHARSAGGRPAALHVISPYITNMRNHTNTQSLSGGDGIFSPFPPCGESRVPTPLEVACVRRVAHDHELPRTNVRVRVHTIVPLQKHTSNTLISIMQPIHSTRHDTLLQVQQLPNQPPPNQPPPNAPPFMRHRSAAQLPPPNQPTAAHPLPAQLSASPSLAVSIFARERVGSGRHMYFVLRTRDACTRTTSP